MPTNDAYKILFLAPFPGTSHWGLMQNIINGLLDHGHQVTTITSINLKQESPNPNYTEILIDPKFDMDKYSKFLHSYMYKGFYYFKCLT